MLSFSISDPDLMNLRIPLKKGIGGESRGDRGVKHRVTVEITLLRLFPPIPESLVLDF
jgi:hypothetical protein